MEYLGVSRCSDLCVNDIDDEMLKQIGIDVLGHRVRILWFLQKSFGTSTEAIAPQADDMSLLAGTLGYKAVCFLKKIDEKKQTHFFFAV